MGASSGEPFRVSRGSDGVLVTVDCDLDLASSIRLGATLGDLIDGQGNLAVAVDLHRVAHVDQRALGVFATAARLASCRGGSLTVTGMPSRSRGWAGDAPEGVDQHLVQFYKSDAVLADSVRRHLEPALRRGSCVVVIATKAHRDLFEATLLGSGIDVDRARAHGLYLELDAAAAVAAVLVDGMPDMHRLASLLGDLVGRAPASDRPVQIYGEMVAALWASGNARGAVALEDLWDDLRRSRRFSLLCAYPTMAFDAKGASGMFRTVCTQHLTTG